jgi:hypothetical protein
MHLGQHRGFGPAPQVVVMIASTSIRPKQSKVDAVILLQIGNLFPVEFTLLLFPTPIGSERRAQDHKPVLEPHASHLI